MKLRIYDLLGQPIFQEVLQSGIHSIPLNTIPAGIYFLQFEDENGGIATRKVLKSKG